MVLGSLVLQVCGGHLEDKSILLSGERNEKFPD